MRGIARRSAGRLGMAGNVDVRDEAGALLANGRS
jgi:hypothetical protein